MPYESQHDHSEDSERDLEHVERLTGESGGARTLDDHAAARLDYSVSEQGRFGRSGLAQDRDDVTALRMVIEVRLPQPSTGSTLTAVP